MQNFIIGLMFLIQPIPVHAETIEVKPLTIEEKIEQTFNNKRMVAVLKCESQFRQFQDGVPLISPTSDVGISQINQVHWKEARDLHLDIFNSIDDNLTMAKRIYDTEGINAWSCNRLIP